MPPLSNEAEIIDVDIDSPTTTVSFYVEDGTAMDEDDFTNSQIISILKDAKCTDIKKTANGWNFTYDDVAYEDVTVEFQQLIKVKVQAKVAVLGIYGFTAAFHAGCPFL